MSSIERSRKTLLANCFRSFGKNDLKDTCCEKCIEEKANLVRITNSTRIACCSKMTYKCFVIFSAEPLYLPFMTITYTIINRNKDRRFENISQYNFNIMVN